MGVGEEHLFFQSNSTKSRQKIERQANVQSPVTTLPGSTLDYSFYANNDNITPDNHCFDSALATSTLDKCYERNKKDPITNTELIELSDRNKLKWKDKKEGENGTPSYESINVLNDCKTSVTPSSSSSSSKNVVLTSCDIDVDADKNSIIPSSSNEYKYVPSIQNKHTVLDDLEEEHSNINLAKRLSLSTKCDNNSSHICTNKQVTFQRSFSKSSSSGCTWDSLDTTCIDAYHCDENELVSGQDTNRNEEICSSSACSQIIREENKKTTHRKLPKTPTSASPRRKFSFQRRLSDPSELKNKIKNKFRSTKTKSLDFTRRFSSRKRKPTEGNEDTDRPLFQESIDKKLYEQAKFKGRRGAVISLEINQSVSFVRQLGRGEEQYSQFNFVPSSNKTVGDPLDE